MKVLIVSNDFIEGQMISLSLKRSGINVYAITHPGSAEELCQRENICAIVTLCHHNIINGSWISKLKANTKLKKAPRIFMVSSIQHEKTVVSLFESSVHQYFTLPIHLPRLSRKLNDHINRLQK